MTSVESETLFITTDGADSTKPDNAVSQPTQNSAPLPQTQPSQEGVEGTATAPQSSIGSHPEAATETEPAAVPTIVLKPPGPMLSHRELVNDCDVMSTGPSNGLSCTHEERQDVAVVTHGIISEDVASRSGRNYDSAERKEEKERIASAPFSPVNPVSEETASGTAVQVFSSSSSGSQPEETAQRDSLSGGGVVKSVCDTGSEGSEATGESVSLPNNSHAEDSVTASTGPTLPNNSQAEDSTGTSGPVTKPDSTEESIKVEQAFSAKVNTSEKSCDNESLTSHSSVSADSTVKNSHDPLSTVKNSHDPLTVNAPGHAVQSLKGDLISSGHDTSTELPTSMPSAVNKEVGNIEALQSLMGGEATQTQTVR